MNREDRADAQKLVDGIIAERQDILNREAKHPMSRATKAKHEKGTDAEILAEALTAAEERERRLREALGVIRDYTGYGHGMMKDEVELVNKAAREALTARSEEPGTEESE